jgi:hypothetical protein
MCRMAGGQGTTTWSLAGVAHPLAWITGLVGISDAMYYAWWRTFHTLVMLARKCKVGYNCWQGFLHVNMCVCQGLS